MLEDAADLQDERPAENFGCCVCVLFSMHTEKPAMLSLAHATVGPVVFQVLLCVGHQLC